PLHPLEQRGPEIEAQGAERRRDTSVAFLFDALVPVMERRGVRLPGNGPGPRVVTRWLVKMPVDHDGSLQPASASATWASTLGNRSSRRASSSAMRPAASRSPPTRALINRSASSQCSAQRPSAYWTTAPV